MESAPDGYYRLHGAHAPAPLTSEKIMLDALLETFGTLAVLASIVAKFMYLRAAPPVTLPVVPPVAAGACRSSALPAARRRR